MMTHRFELPPTRLDVALARDMFHHAAPALERSVKPITFLADEKLVLGAAVAFWLVCRATRRDRRARACADQVVLGAAIAAAIPHVVKRLVARERPDRKVVGFIRHGVPRSGNARDSFPSGHAVQVGALAAAGARMIEGPARFLVWPAALALAATRLVLLAHYLSDALAGLFLGIAIDRLVARALRLPIARAESRAAPRSNQTPLPLREREGPSAKRWEGEGSTPLFG
jgi:membrane-associated phospholipid phosphatase